ncbi:phosphotyrosyl phosphatase activator protein [Perkinsela sp. CCAP 1560/4]|nr:phosphotyrosyl phosphatase activator protein [Perkinsela sp. CCAP 1560/4]|eukprot:KNH05555.1 phosphotyrosyl phosphatase activator protein [Perkinsela sp. CCAP 1560/4]
MSSPQVTHLRSPAALRRLTSSTFFQNEFLWLLDALCASARGEHQPPSCATSTAPTAVLRRLLAYIRSLASEIDLGDASVHRFGNPAFRRFISLVRQRIPPYLEVLVAGPQKDSPHDCVDILALYLTRSFGSEERIDYGTGHELNFFAFVFCLHRVGYIQPNQFHAIFTVFCEYFALARFIIRRFALEPAGSRGVWGIDDYQFLPFLLGSSQLVGGTSLTPMDATTPSIAAKHAEELLFCTTVVAVSELKTGDFREHSAYLHFIRTRVNSWEKVRVGLRNMYESEVLNKFVVMKHFPLSRLIPPQ